jgi:asparagine synthase (glutamine-hydrolysing)
MAGDKPDFLLQSGQTAAIWDFESVMDRQKQDIDRFSVPVLAHYEDRNSMAASIESRLPFLDHRLVDFLLGLPVEMKMRNGWPKYVLRKSIHELPDSIRWRRDKKGFITPETIWLKNQLVPMVKGEFIRSGLHDAGFIDKAKFLRYYDEFLEGKPNRSSSLIFRTYIFEKWYKQLFV